MTLISTIITDAYRETNLIARGATETSGEQTEALRLLNRCIESLFGFEAGDPLQEMLFGRNQNIDEAIYDNEFELFIRRWYMPAGYRLKLNLGEPSTIKLFPNPEDGAMFGVVDASNNLSTNNFTIDGNGSLIEGQTELVLNTDGYSGVWFYRADKGNWQRITDLEAVDQSPFPRAFDDLLILELAMRLDPRNGSALSQLSMSRYGNMLKKFRARYSQVKERPLDWALARINGQQRRYLQGYSVEGEFERGSIFRF